ncbi:MAG: hypothetical protein SV422_08825 [Pseudomonadota bacterium]|nr:hypothetical protein [Pseudomonadota bacterium]
MKQKIPRTIEAHSAESTGALHMPSYWSNKDERQYKHVRKSELEEGRTEKRAEQIAAATVNKQRSSEGRTKSSTGKSSKSKRSGSDS